VDIVSEGLSFLPTAVYAPDIRYEPIAGCPQAIQGSSTCRRSAREEHEIHAGRHSRRQQHLGRGI